MTVGIVYWTFMVGFMMGALTKYLFHEDMRQGELFTSMTVGLIGSVLGNWLGSLTGAYHFGEKIGLIGSFIGALIALISYSYYFKRKSKAV